MKKYFVTFWPFLIITGFMIAAFWPFFSEGKIPVAGDILLGQYYPWLDYRWDNYSTIFPVLNNTIGDSLFSFYSWKFAAVKMLKSGVFPIYDPSTYMGSQLFSTGTTGLFYPLNILFFLLEFNFAWGIISASTVLLSSGFFYLWLRNKGLEKIPVLITSIAYGFSAFIGLQVTFINTAHSVLWLPVILFTIDKLFLKGSRRYFLLLIFCLFSSLNAGFFQGSLYVFVTSFLYAVYLFWKEKKRKDLFLVALGFIFSVLLSAVQIIPFMESVSQSSRLANYGSSGQASEIFEFFVKPKFFLTTFFPDFFGNPGKGNYFAEFGYYEFNNFSGTIAVIGFIFGLTLLRKQREVRFFLTALFISILFASANPLSRLPYELSVPVISSLIPARLLAVSQFSLLVIAGFGLNLIYLNRITLKKYLSWIVPLFIFYGGLLILTFIKSRNLTDLINFDGMRWEISFRNVLLPSLLFFVSVLMIFLYIKLKRKIFFSVLILITGLELIRQTSYFRPFIKPDLIFPETATTDFLEKNSDGLRFMITGQDLIPTNSQLFYNFKIVDGEGPIYPKKHGNFMASINLKEYGDELPSYRRMVYFRNTNTPLLGLLNIKYVVTREPILDPSLKEVFAEGETKIYENLKVFPRAWTVSDIRKIDNPVITMKTLSSPEFDPEKTVIISGTGESLITDDTPAGIENFEQSYGSISFNSTGAGNKVAVISEQYYPNWRLFIDGNEFKPFPVDYNLLGIYLPEGEHQIRLKFEMQSFKIGAVISVITLGLLILFMAAGKTSGLRKLF